MTAIASRMTRRGFALALVLALAACNGLKVDPAAETVAKAAYVSLVRADDAGLMAMMEPAQRTPGVGPVLAKMRALIPTRAPDAPVVPTPELTNWTTNVGTGGTTLTLQHTYDYGEAAVVVTSVLVPAARKGDWWLRAFNVNLTSSPPDAPATPDPNPKTPA